VEVLQIPFTWHLQFFLQKTEMLFWSLWLLNLVIENIQAAMIEPFTHSKMVSPVKIIETGRCKICRAPARYSYYGVISCQSCKMFFKRNAEARRVNWKHNIIFNLCWFIQGQLRCHFSNQCDIDVNNRHTCSACRLEKCFIHGMRTELIRCGHGRKKGRNGKKNLPDLVTSTILVPFNNRNQPGQVRIFLFEIL
jgi:hypothetical protein